MSKRSIALILAYLAGMLLFSYTYARWEVCGSGYRTGTAGKAEIDRLGVTICAVLWPLTAPFTTSCVLAEKGQEKNRP